MSWTAGVLGGLGLLSDVAGNIGNIVTQQQMVKNQRKQLEIQQRALDEQVRLAERGQNLSAFLSVNAPQLAYSNARSLGYSHAEALQLTGGTRVSYGGVNVEPRSLPTMPFYNVGNNSLARAYGVVAQFKQGTTGFTLAQPIGFSNPNYGVKLTSARVNLEHNPGQSIV